MCEYEIFAYTRPKFFFSPMQQRVEHEAKKSNERKADWESECQKVATDFSGTLAATIC